MAMENIDLDPSFATASSVVGTTDCEIQLIYGSDKPEKGYNIPVDKIERVVLREDFFLPLPTLTLYLNDTGMFFHDVNFQIGNTFFLKLTPVLGDPDLVPKPFVDASFIIQAMEYNYDADRSDYLYKIYCIYGAEKYINDICIWPRNDTVAGKIVSVNKEYTSKDVLEAVMTGAGLKYTCDVLQQFDDSMSWLNSNMTYQEFAKKIISHAWIKNDDMPLMYVDRTGTAHYTSVNTLCDTATVCNYTNATKYQKVYKPRAESEKSDMYRIYQDVSLSNYGFLQNIGGYNVKSCIFNPYNIKEMNIADFKQMKFNVTNPMVITKNDSCFRIKQFKDNGQNEKGRPRLANLSNRSATQGETCRYITASTHFKQTHEYYDYAPVHHESIRHAFFQQFAFMTLSMSEQPGMQIMKLGDRIGIDFSTIANDTTVQTCDFIISGLTHDITFGRKYTIVATCVTDGIGGIGQLKKETKNTQR